MATIKKYNGSTWENAVVRKYGTATETIQSGDTIYANGQPISTYTIKGNTVQDGTPTPSNPIPVVGVGEETANLFDVNTGVRGYYINASGVEVANTSSEYEFAHTRKIPVEPNMIYTYSLSVQRLGMYRRIIGYDANGDFIEQITEFNVTSLGYHTTTITIPQNCYYITINYVDDAYNNADLNTMLNVGSTAQSYEPYGYKIPILNGQQTTPVYLGEVQTTRKIKKLVFDGTEDWNNLYGQSLFGAPRLLDSEPFIVGISAYSTHFIYNPVQSGLDAAMSNGEFALQKTANVPPGYSIFLKNTAFTTAADFKSWVASQYAAGTPVTIWYVLATPTTDTVNEPLMKIGDYADSIANATAIPTTDGANQISIDTTVQPSELSATWTGWHDASVKEKSENLIPTNISDWEQGSISSTDGTDTVSTIRLRTIDFYPINNNTNYYISVNDTDYCYVNIILYDSSKQYAGQYYLVDSAINGATALAINVPSSAIANVAYYRAVAKKRDDSTITAQEITDIKPMLNLGSTALPYEPYWK